ncbi:MAG TPA: 50S ribosomal protein L15 [Lacipirellulaceae bacterium]|nr:50S ribosomal protein L15 [Lacipirellulaceae bacterium]
MNITDIHRGVHKNRSRKRLGRGIGSGHGKTAGRGHKGQWARNGVSFLSIFEGGTMPLVRRVPKRGFNNRWAKTILVLNVGDLNGVFKSGDHVTPESLAAVNLAKGCYDELKILGDGEVTKKLKISAHRFSKSATEKITAAGGEAIVLAGKAPVVKNQKRVKAGAKSETSKG